MQTAVYRNHRVHCFFDVECQCWLYDIYLPNRLLPIKKDYLGSDTEQECLQSAKNWIDELESNVPDWVVDRELCSKCNGGGLIQEDDELICCPECEGSGSI